MDNKLEIDSQRWNEFVLKLIRETEAGNVVWEVLREPDRDDATSPIYVAKISGKEKTSYVAVYQYSYPYYLTEDYARTVHDVRIELVDHRGSYLWRLPTVPARGELFQLVEFVVTKASDVLVDFLGKEAS